jgi:hypothetical protein
LPNSTAEAATPFIFQLPATSGRGVVVTIVKSFSACGYQSRRMSASTAGGVADPS